MRRSILILLFCFSVFTVRSQNGKVFESLEFESNLVQYPVKYSVYLPPDYETSNRSYPVVYLLHGYTDDETAWIQFGEANRIADKGIKNGDFASSLIVMPDGKVTWYCNNFNGKDPWEDMFIKEFIPFIEKKYRIRTRKEFRAIAGLSMGGNGALMLSMRHTDLFSSCVALSAAIRTDEEIMANYANLHNLKDVYGPVSKDGVSDHWKAHSPLHLLDNVEISKLKSVRYYIDCGDDDSFSKGNAVIHVKMKDKVIPHEFRVRDGSHEWSYWRTGLYDGLKYISEKFHR